MLPFLPLVSFAAVAMGMLNAQDRFGTPGRRAGHVQHGLDRLGGGPVGAGLRRLTQVALGWAVGTLLGGAAQFLIQVPPLWREGWRPRPEWAPGDPGIRARSAG